MKKKPLETFWWQRSLDSRFDISGWYRYALYLRTIGNFRRPLIIVESTFVENKKLLHVDSSSNSMREFAKNFKRTLLFLSEKKLSHNIWHESSPINISKTATGHTITLPVGIRSKFAFS